MDSAAAAGQNLGPELGSRKRKAEYSNNLVGNRDLEVACDDSQRISEEIEYLRSQLDEDVKELGYCEENEKLRVELALKVKEMQCLRKQNEDLQVKYKRVQKNIMEILENQIDVKKKHLRQFEGLQGKRMVHKSCDEDSSSKLVDETLAEKSAVNRKADDEKSKQLELEVAKLDAEIQGKMENLIEMLEHEKFPVELSSATVRKYIQTNMELQDTRRELIAGLKDMKSRDKDIGIKMLGELSVKPFEDACRMKHGNDEPEIKTAKLLATWQYKVMEPSWRPFKIVETDGIMKEVVNDDDAELKQLLAEYGNDVCDAVKTALSEMKEHSPCGRYMVSELWNLAEGRKATMREVVKSVVSQLQKKSGRFHG